MANSQSSNTNNTNYNTNYNKVCEFNRIFDFPVLGHNSNALDNTKVAKLRCDLIKEEGVVEFKKAHEENDIVEQLDSIADLLYVLYGLCYTYSFDPNHYVNLVFSNNNSKISNFKIIYNNFNSEDYTVESVYAENCELECMLRKAMLEDKDIVATYITTMCMIVNAYKLGILLNFDIDKLFDIVHNSNMSKLCKTEQEAIATVDMYLNKINNGDNTYDSPYYYQNNNYYIVKNKSTGKSLKSINYTPVKLNLDELKLVSFIKQIKNLFWKAN